MGFIVHHAIVVVGYGDKAITAAHEKAKLIFPWVSEICPEKVNGYRSFFIPPDGSKEGWEESNLGNQQREIFIRYLRTTSLDFVEVKFGADYNEATIDSHADDNNHEKETH